MLGFSQRWGPCPNFLHFYCLAETYGKRPVLHEYLAESGRLSCLMFCTLSRAAAVCHFLTVETQCIIWNTDMKRRPWTKKPFVCVFGRCPWSWHSHFHSNSFFFFFFFFFSLSGGVASIRLHNPKRQSSFNGGILGFHKCTFLFFFAVSFSTLQQMVSWNQMFPKIGPKTRARFNLVMNGFWCSPHNLPCLWGSGLLPGRSSACQFIISFISGQKTSRRLKNL